MPSWAAMDAEARFAEALARLPDYLGNHVLVSITALALGLGTSLPLAILSMHRPALRAALMTFANVVQTIPGLALLALFYPLLLALAALCERLFGKGFSALGFLPAVLALALYSMLPVLRNTVTGLAAVPPSLREAARLFGAGPARLMTDVELPLALPVIMAGIRTSAVWVIGTATLATPIGQTSLGNYIFSGLQTQNWVFVAFGCTAAAALALVVDHLLALMERGIAGRSRARLAAGGGGLALLLLAALAPLAPSLAPMPPSYVVGAKPFAEQYVLAALLEQRLTAAGLSSRRREGLGSTVLFDALAAGEVDVAVDYSGTLWTNFMHRSDRPDRAAMLAALAQWLRASHGIRLLGALGFENAYALAMTRARAQALGIHSIADLAARAGTLTIAGDYEFFSRPEWRTLREAYGLRFGAQRIMQPEFLYRAAADGDADVISAYTSDGRIAQYDLVTLADTKQVIPHYDAVVLLSARCARDEALVAALAPLVGAIDLRLMRAANRRVADGSSPDETAGWLWDSITRAGADRALPGKVP